MISTKYKAVEQAFKSLTRSKSNSMSHPHVIKRSSLQLSTSPVNGLELFKNTTICPKKDALKIQGHRGAGPKHNTLGAFQMAIDYGLDAVELDVWLTKDRKLAVFHGEGDFGLIPYQGEKVKITDLTLEQIQSINVHDQDDVIEKLEKKSSSVCSDSFTSSSYGEIQVNDDRIPTLEQALNVCKGNIRVNIELKGGDDEEFLVQSTIDLVHDLDMDEEIELSSFQHRFCPIATAHINDKNKEIEDCQDKKKQIKFGFLVEFKSDLSEQLLEKEDLEGHSLNFPPDFLDCEETVNKLQLLNQKQKMMLTTWFSYDIEETQVLYDKLVDIGVSCIITNQPEYINNYKKGVLLN